jgi:hypothetical protein
MLTNYRLKRSNFLFLDVVSYINEEITSIEDIAKSLKHHIEKASIRIT